MSKLMKLIGAIRVLFAAVLCLLSLTFLAPLALAETSRAPDYASADGHDWFCHHDIAEKRSALDPSQDPGVDLFFVLPTAAITNSETTVNGFVDLDEPQMRGGASVEFDKTGRVFADFTRVYAPFYRQATLDKAHEIVADHPDCPNEAYAEALYDSVAYADITNALTHYFTVINPDGKRPFILAGHSQGSALLRNVVVHFFPGHKAWLDNLVACYAIGYGVDADWVYMTAKETTFKIVEE